VTIPEGPERRQYLQSELKDPYRLDRVGWLLMQTLLVSDIDNAQRRALMETVRTYIPPDREEIRANIPHTSISVILSESRGLNFTILTALLADVAAKDTAMGALAVLAAAGLDRVRTLNDDELEVFRVMRELSFGKVYRVWVEEDELLAAMDPELDIEARKRLLASMQSRGILEEGAGKWRAVW
jgi:hypothetical protein